MARHGRCGAAKTSFGLLLLPIVVVVSSLLAAATAHGGHNHGHQRDLLAVRGGTAVPRGGAVVRYGRDALLSLGARLPDAARANGLATAQLKAILERGGWLQ